MRRTDPDALGADAGLLAELLDAVGTAGSPLSASAADLREVVRRGTVVPRTVVVRTASTPPTLFDALIGAPLSVAGAGPAVSVTLSRSAGTAALRLDDGQRRAVERLTGHTGRQVGHPRTAAPGMGDLHSGVRDGIRIVRDAVATHGVRRPHAAGELGSRPLQVLLPTRGAPAVLTDLPHDRPGPVVPAAAHRLVVVLDYPDLVGPAARPALLRDLVRSWAPDLAGSLILAVDGAEHNRGDWTNLHRTLRARAATTFGPDPRGTWPALTEVVPLTTAPDAGLHRAAYGVLALRERLLRPVGLDEVLALVRARVGARRRELSGSVRPGARTRLVQIAHEPILRRLCVALRPTESAARTP
jgi:hypothetical protein